MMTVLHVALAAALSAAAPAPATNAAATVTAVPAVTAPVAPRRDLPMPPDAIKGLLIQNALIGLNQANLANDYDVLLKNASPSFQKVNTGAGLSDQFRGFRDAKIDLSPLVLLNPELTREPTMTGNVLHLVGKLPSAPMQTDFDLFFEWDGARFRLASLSVGLKAAPAPASRPATPAKRK